MVLLRSVTLAVSMMMLTTHGAVPQSPAPQSVIQLERITSAQLEARQKEWSDRLSTRTIKKYVGYATLGAAVAGAVYALYRASKKDQASTLLDRPVGRSRSLSSIYESLHESRPAYMPIVQPYAQPFATMLKHYAKSAGCLFAVGTVLFAIDHLLLRAYNGAASLLGGNDEDDVLVLTRKMLADHLRLDNSCARLCAALQEPAGPLQHKIHAYIMRDVIIDNAAFVQSFEDWAGFVFAALKRSSLDAHQIEQLQISIMQLCSLVNEVIEHEEKFLLGQTPQQGPEIYGNIYNECLRMAHVTGVLLYGKKFLSAAQQAA
ncbi:MAG: hypothetical protein WCW33_02375 [Candidatus Babeliales bacterium]|jgi:hypothetical protein